MARPLRILVAGGWYHVVARGNNRQAVYLDDRDRERFLGLVAELPDRFRVEVHGEWGRDGAMCVAVQYGGLRLAEVVRGVPGLSYMAAAQGVKRFAARLEKDEAARRFVGRLKRNMSGSPA